MSDPDKLLVDSERIRSVLRQAPLVLMVTVINTALTAVVLAPVVSHELLTIWGAMIAAVSCVRLILRQRLFRGPLDDGRYRLSAAICTLGSLTTGILWGIGATVLFPAVQTYQLFWAFVIGGMCAGTASVNSAHMPTVLAFIVPASLPLAGRFLAEGSKPGIVSGLMILIFASSLSLSSFRAHRAFGERVRLQFALSRQGRALSDANDRLRAAVAERKKAEAIMQQAQKMEAVGNMTGGIAHDFNNLLQVMTGSLSMIERLALGNTRILDHVRTAEHAAKQGVGLTSSLLAFARRQPLRVERLNLNTLLHEFEPILRRAVNDKIRLRISIVQGLPDCMADPAHFQSAILNLVVNARDAMPEGGQLSITADVVTLRAEDLLANPDAIPGRFVSVAVRDTGCGMTKEVLARACEPFFTTKEIDKGSGLGLSQVYGFVRQSGGDVQLESQPGAGTCVTLYLPVANDAPIPDSQIPLP